MGVLVESRLFYGLLSAASENCISTWLGLMRVMNQMVAMAAVLFTPLMALAELEPGEPCCRLSFLPQTPTAAWRIAGGLIGAGIGGLATSVVAPVGLEFRSATPCWVVRLMGADDQALLE